MHRVVLASLLLFGCGRFGFGDDSADAVPDASAPALMEFRLPAPFSTPSATFVDVPGASLTLPPSPETTWLVLTSAQLESPTLISVTVEARYLLDGVELGMGGTQTSTPGFPGPWQHFAVVAGTSAPQELRYQLRDASAAGGIMDELTSIAIPLAAGDLAYAANDPPHDITSLAATADSVLSLGPLSGDYIVMLLLNTTDLPAESDCFVAWSSPAGAVWLADLQQPRESWQSIMTVRRESLDVANAQVTLLAHYGSGAPCQVRNVRAVAIRASAFASIDYARSDDDTIATASATPVTTLTLAPAASSATQFLAWGNAVLDEDCFTVADAHRTVTFTRDAVQTSIAHATDNCSYTATYGSLALLPSKPSSMSLAVSSGTGVGVVDHLASELLLLGLR